MSGYSRDVGTKTTLRITYPEGAIQKTERYEKDSLFVFSAFKPLDFKWLRQMVFREKLVRSNAVVCDYTVLFLSLKSVEIVLFVLFLRSLILKQNYASCFHRPMSSSAYSCAEFLELYTYVNIALQQNVLYWILIRNSY